MTRFLIHGLAWLVITGVTLAGTPEGMGGVTRSVGAAQAARLGREFKVKVGRVVQLKGESLRLKLVAVENDSRCPKNVNCVWAGNAEVLLEVGTPGARAKELLRLSTNPSPQSAGEGKYRRYQVKLVELSPQPRDGRKISPGEYTATLLVVKE